MAESRGNKKTTMKGDSATALDEYLVSSNKSNRKPLMDSKSLESWLWDAACSIRGPVDAPKFKDYILPLIFMKRLSDVFDDELARLAEQFESPEMALKIIEKDHTLVRFYIPTDSRWKEIRKTTDGLGQKITESIRNVTKENPTLQGVADIVDFNSTISGQRIIDDDRLSTLVEILSNPKFSWVCTMWNLIYLAGLMSICSENSRKARGKLQENSLHPKK